MRFVAALLLTLSTAVQAAPSPVALLPAVGPADDNDRRDVDAALRQALLDAEELDLLSPVATRDNLMSLAEMGLVCLPEDVACLVKLGIVADVLWVLVPEVDKPVGDKIRVAIGVIDVAGGRRARTVDGNVSLGDEAAIGGLARRAMDLPAKASPPDKPPPDKVPPDKLPDGPEPDPNQPPPPSPGVIVAGIGGVVAGVSFVGALVAEGVYWNIIQANAETRKNLQPVGAILWGTTLVGVATAGVGIYLLTEEAAAAE